MIYCNLDCPFKEEKELDSEFSDYVFVCAATEEAWEAAVALGQDAGAGGVNGGSVPHACPIWQGLVKPWNDMQEGAGNGDS